MAGGVPFKGIRGFHAQGFVRFRLHWFTGPGFDFGVFAFLGV